MDYFAMIAQKNGAIGFMSFRAVVIHASNVMMKLLISMSLVTATRYRHTMHIAAVI
ncbi:hypothetical protein SFC43_01370 [Bacteroides sp. CR5/BHMF/2]|nr:hypothetical protein [Bacteroides sp. CR5/BHMF/2]